MAHYKETEKGQGKPTLPGLPFSRPQARRSIPDVKYQVPRCAAVQVFQALFRYCGFFGKGKT